MTRRRVALPVALAALLLAPPAASARPPHKKALADRIGPAFARKLNDCRTCHLAPEPDADPEDRPHNPFGARLKAVRLELKRAGRPGDIVARLEAIADEDSDGDGA